MKRIQILLYAAVAAMLAFIGDTLNRYTRFSGLAARANLYSQFIYDARLLLKTAALVAATGNGSLILDVGNGVIDGFLVVDVTAIETATTDESYEVILQGSPDATFATAGNIVALASISLGHASSVRLTAQGQGATDVVGRVALPVRNEKNGTTFRYLRTRTVVVGTIATGINYRAWLAKR